MCAIFVLSLGAFIDFAIRFLFSSVSLLISLINCVLSCVVLNWFFSFLIKDLFYLYLELSRGLVNSNKFSIKGCPVFIAPIF